VRELTTAFLLLGVAESAWARQEEAPPAPPGAAREERPREEAERSRNFARFAFNFYRQNDGGGNPHLEEDMTVLEPTLLFSHSLSEAWTGTFKVQGDIISAASIEKRFPAGTQSGASGDRYLNLEGGAFYAWSDQVNVGGGVSFSTEFDYRSLGFFLKGSYDTPTKNDTLAVKFSAYFDTLDLNYFDGTGGSGTDTRRSISAGLGWTHVMGPRTLGTLNWDLTLQNGYLSTPYNSVVTAGTEVREILPEARVRNAFFGRVRHLLWDDLAVEAGAGGYFDDWGATAFHVEVNLFWEAFPKTLILRPSYRFHDQTEVDYFLPDTAAVIPEFRTQDSDLAAFSSHTLGLKLTFPHVRFLGEAHEVEVGFDYTIRSDNLDSLSVTVGYLWRF
jgi:hypothetical protein